MMHALLPLVRLMRQQNPQSMRARTPNWRLWPVPSSFSLCLRVGFVADCLRLLKRSVKIQIDASYCSERGKKKDILCSSCKKHLSVSIKHVPKLTYHNHLRHVALRASVFSWIFNFDKNYKVQIMPHVVLWLYMLLKRNGLVIKFVSLQSCKKTWT